MGDNRLKYLFFLFAILLGKNALALVDYSETEEASSKMESSQKFTKKVDKKSVSKNAASFDFGTSFEAVDVADKNGAGKATLAKIQESFKRGITYLSILITGRQAAVTLKLATIPPIKKAILLFFWVLIGWSLALQKKQLMSIFLEA